MSSNKITSVFSVQTINLMKTLSKRFPNDKDIQLGLSALEKLKMINKKKIIEIFVLYCYKFREDVMTKNHNFFLNRDFISEDLEENGDKEYGMQLMVNLKKHWSELDENEKESIWKYLQVLMSLSDKHIAQSLNK
jgi:hypothetical protein